MKNIIVKHCFAILSINWKMKRVTVIICTTMLFANAIHAQSFNKSINKDSLFQSILKDIPEEKRSELITEYNSRSDQEKELFLFMLSMPKSSKNELIKNIDSNYDRVDHLKTEYAKLVPANSAVLIEFNPEDKLMNTKESIDLRITRNENGRTFVFQDWRLTYKSEKLKKMLKMINWNTKTLNIIKQLLADAHCVSIENGEIVTIGFARSGIGKYYYKLFEKDLSSDQIKRSSTSASSVRLIFSKSQIFLSDLKDSLISEYSSTKSENPLKNSE